MDWQLEPLGMTLEELRSHRTGIRYEPAGKPAFEKYEKVFTTKSSRLNRAPFLAQGKVALYNTQFEEAGFARMG